MVSLQSIIWVFLLNNFSRVINLLLTKLARDRPGRTSALGLFCTDFAALGPYCQDLWPIFSQYGPRTWLIAFDKERLHSAVSMKNFGLSIHGHQFCPPRKIFQGRNYSGRNDVISIEHVFCSSRSRVSRFALRVGVLPCLV